MSKGKAAFGVLFAAAAGVVAGILTAPKSGKETRRDLQRKADELKHDADQKKDQAKRKFEDTKAQFDSKSQEFKNRAKDISNKVKKAKDDTSPKK